MHPWTVSLSFFVFLLIRHCCQIRFISPSLFSFILYNSSSGYPSFVFRKSSRLLPRPSSLHNKWRQLREQRESRCGALMISYLTISDDPANTRVRRQAAACRWDEQWRHVVMPNVFGSFILLHLLPLLQFLLLFDQVLSSAGWGSARFLRSDTEC